MKLKISIYKFHLIYNIVKFNLSLHKAKSRKQLNIQMHMAFHFLNKLTNKNLIQ